MHRSTLAWDDVRIFLAIAETGSLSKACQRLRVTQPTVSRRLAEIESSLGEPLFVRSRTGARLTSFGESLLEPSRRMAEWAAEVDRAAERAESTPRGTVRITAPPGIAFDFLAPFAAWAKERLPNVDLEVVSTVQYVDLSRRDADLALRFAAPARSDVASLASIDVPVGVFAAARYTKKLPKKPRAADIAWIAWAPPLDHISPNPELARMIPAFRPAFASDDYVVQLRAAEAGVGAMLLGRTQHRFAAPRLVEIDVGLTLPKRRLHLAAARSALAIPRVRAVADLLLAELPGVT
jgi:DNA-binding transcriptional LysR family regulator